MLSKTLLIDGDIILFKLAFRHQRKAFGQTFVDSADEAIDDMVMFIEDLITDTGCLNYVIALSDFTNFRKSFNPAYKIKRKDVEKPQLLSKLRAAIETNYTTLTLPTLEADDVIGILASQDINGYIVASTDKDLMQIAGLHYDWRSGEWIPVSPEEGKKFFYRQVLSGDPTDGYYGVPGVGRVKARRFVDEWWEKGEGELWRAIEELYEDKGLTKEEALLNARQAFILDKEHWDSEREKVILWEPVGMND